MKGIATSWEKFLKIEWDNESNIWNVIIYWSSYNESKKNTAKCEVKTKGCIKFWKKITKIFKDKFYYFVLEDWK